MLIKCFKIGGTKSLTHKQKILVLERFCYISKSRKNLSFSNLEMQVSATYLYYPGEPIIHSGKGLLHWKALRERDCSIGKHFKWQWLIDLVGYILPCQRRRPSLFLGIFLGKFGAQRLSRSTNMREHIYIYVSNCRNKNSPY